MSKIASILSTCLVILMFISIAPGLITTIVQQYQDLLKPQVKVALIKIEGTISDNDTYITQLNRVFEDKDIKAVLLEIDSPGGHAGSSQAIVNELVCLKKEYPKPVVVLTNDLCASAGYYIASTADYIIASPSAIIGSIGTAISFFNISELLKKYDVNYITKHAGLYKAIGSPYEPSNEANEKLLQEIARDSYEQFTNDVAANRKLSIKDVDIWANGKIFTGSQALKIGLVDECGSKYNVIKKIRELALIKEEEKITWVKEQKSGKWTKFFENNMQTNLSVKDLGQIVNALIAKLQSVFILN